MKTTNRPSATKSIAIDRDSLVDDLMMTGWFLLIGAQTILLALALMLVMVPGYVGPLWRSLLR